MTTTTTTTAPAWNTLLDALADDGLFPSTLHRLFIYGPPGTGKSAWAQFRFGRERVERVTLHEQMSPEDLIGSWTLQNGSTVWADGPAVRAMRRGAVLVLDEMTRHSADVACALYAMCDDLRQAALTLPTGETVTPAPGFAVIGTDNGTPADLPEALADRMDLCVHATTPAPGILADLPDDCGALLARLYDERAKTATAWLPAPSVRRMQTFAALSGPWGRERAAGAIFGPNGADLLTTLAMHAGAK